MDVGIVGCGFAGGAAALFLARAGHDVTVYEAVEEPTAVGAGIVVQPTGLVVLDRLGLYDAAIERGAPIDHLLCMKGRTDVLLDLHYKDVAPGLFGLGMHRGSLFEILYGAIRREGIDVKTGCTIETARRESDKTVLVADGADVAAHDLVVAANGARSNLHHLVGPRVREYPWGALWFVADDPNETYGRTLFQVVRGTRQLLGFLPSGLSPGGGGHVVSLFWSVPCDGVEAWRSGYEGWREHLLSEDPRCAFILDQIHGPDDLLFSRYHDVVMFPWHTEGVVFIGDAAHATSPQLGQGTNLALVDALTLAVILAEEGTLEARLWRYAKRRRAHLAYYQLASRWLTPFFQSSYDWIGPLRDFAMPLAAKLPPIRDAMTRSMVGVKRGLLRPSLPIAPYVQLLAGAEG
ncbi:MAG: NAD(P)/FAD-dependent oxidoreductase [Deltaproteobacteria bacterium]